MNKTNKPRSSFVRFTTTVLAVLSLSLGCQSKQNNDTPSAGGETPQGVVSKERNEISVMTFNVENLFDTLHDAGTNDHTYLPLKDKKNAEVAAICRAMTNPFYRKECFEKDWNEEVVRFKLSQVAKVIRYVDQGRGPDNILLAEVENLNILTQLVRTELKDLGYKTISLIEGPDGRGIDTAFISKFPLVGQPIIHIVPYMDPTTQKPIKSRGVLETTVMLPNGRPVTFLSCHFPSQANPTIFRKQAHEFIRNKMLEYQNQGRAVIAGGDLNTIPEEDAQFGYFKNILSSAGQVSHLVGCSSCDGSHFYKGSWSFLDVLVYGKALNNSGLTLLPNSIQIVKAPAHMKADGTPLRFDEIKREGVADHFPLYSRLRLD